MVLPESLHDTDIQLAHRGSHPGRSGIERRLRYHFFFHGMYDKVKQFAKNARCLLTKRQKSQSHIIKFLRRNGKLWQLIYLGPCLPPDTLLWCRILDPDILLRNLSLQLRLTRSSQFWMKSIQSMGIPIPRFLTMVHLSAAKVCTSIPKIMALPHNFLPLISQAKTQQRHL